MAAMDKTSLECVMKIDYEHIKLEIEAERLAAVTDNDGKNFVFSFVVFMFTLVETIIKKGHRYLFFLHELFIY
jgi:hypothetical protein